MSDGITDGYRESRFRAHPKPIGCSLNKFSTAELIAELKTRPHDEICPVINEMGEPACVFVIPTKSLVRELSRRDGVRTPRAEIAADVVRDLIWDAVRAGKPDPQILVVRE